MRGVLRRLAAWWKGPAAEPGRMLPAMIDMGVRGRFFLVSHVTTLSGKYARERGVYAGEWTGEWPGPSTTASLLVSYCGRLNSVEITSGKVRPDGKSTEVRFVAHWVGPRK